MPVVQNFITFELLRCVMVQNLVLIRYEADTGPVSLIQIFSFTYKSSSCTFLKERPIFLLVGHHDATESHDGTTTEPSGGGGWGAKCVMQDVKRGGVSMRALSF